MSGGVSWRSLLGSGAVARHAAAPFRLVATSTTATGKGGGRDRMWAQPKARPLSG
jgi:hypothetical protein